MSEFHDQKIQMIKEGLIIGNFSSGGSLLAAMCETNSTKRQQEIAKARAAYLEKNGAEAIKAKFPKAYFLAYPGL
jgi:hypothetical protein